MRVLHVSSGNMFGGIESLLVTLARFRACAPDMHPEFALAFDGRVSRELGQAGVPVHLLGAVRASRPTSVWRARRAFADLLARARFDVVVCHAPWPHAIFAPVAKRVGTPLVFWSHGPTERRHWVERWASLTMPDLAICNSSFTAQSIGRLFPRCAHLVVYCPVASPPSAGNTRDSLRGAMAVFAETVVILALSRFEPWKGHHQLIEALARLPENPRWVCWIVGQAQNEKEARYRGTLAEAINRCGLAQRVTIRAAEDVPVGAFYAAADLFCQANTQPDAFGIVFVEAMLSGLPVVTTAIGGPREFLDDTSAILTAPEDVGGIARAVAALVSDADRRRRLGHAGAAMARARFMPETILPTLDRELRARVLSGATQPVEPGAPRPEMRPV